MPDPYPLAEEEFQAEWLRLEAEHRERVLSDSLPHYQHQLDEVVDGWRARWAAEADDEVTADEYKRNIIDGFREDISHDYQRYERSRAALRERGADLLAQARTEVPPDPVGGHRPLWFGSLGGGHHSYGFTGEGPVWNALLCLDCDWTWVVDAVDLVGVARRHRAAHLDPPAWAVCEREELPHWFYDRAADGVRRRMGLAAEVPEDRWPGPAIGAISVWEGRHGPYLYRVCASCLERERGLGQDVGDGGWDGRFFPAGSDGPGNPVRSAPWNLPGFPEDRPPKSQDED